MQRKVISKDQFVTLVAAAIQSCTDHDPEDTLSGNIAYVTASCWQGVFEGLDRREVDVAAADG